MIYVPDADIDRLIAEDSGFGDLTTTALGIGGEPGVMRFTTRHAMIVCAIEEAGRLLARLGAQVELAAGSGQWAEPGTPLLAAHGPAASLHAGWKAAQTLVEWASGIATGVRAIVDAARAQRPDIVVACTRKAAPFTRGLSIKAVHAGGGTMHRTGLSDTVLLFAEHRVFIADVDEAVVVARLRAAAPERKIAVEVSTPDAALAYAQAGADVLQLEKFSPELVSQVVRAIAGLPGRPLIVAAGGVNATNAAAYAIAGADVLATSAPYVAPPRDVQVTLSRSASF
ncbi:ModD protein [Rhodopila globiformis]|uniref:Putative pyrophosphorylase ModD n=1 Tax=Rhodopila globiformis TaxID=1071 RepID=A0A2S6NKI5_RHOGL|nr:ModD protein [Rhodopila globiformis]PPQ35481.1 ModD protein [Rhodopila globiformis]